jgi:hypothetical protein
VLITCYNRPLYLWACLDSFYRHTRHPHRFTMLDMASEDPLVARVIAGYERRGMFSQVIRAPRNNAEELWKVLWSLVEGSGEVVGYAEGDVIVEDRDPCWLGAFMALMARHPRLAMVGSAIDTRDFVSWARARALEPDLEERQLAGLIKLQSPEREQDLSGMDGRDLAWPHNPPGRLLLLRSAALTRVGAGTDWVLDRRFRDAGYETGIATAVRHRHLSLLNLFDYPGYDTARRDAFMKSIDSPGAERKACD